LNPILFLSFKPALAANDTLRLSKAQSSLVKTQTYTSFTIWFFAAALKAGTIIERSGYSSAWNLGYRFIPPIRGQRRKLRKLQTIIDHFPS